MKLYRKLDAARIPTTSLRSKSWEEFSQPGFPKLDFVFTVCDKASMEACPVWPGQPMYGALGVPDPAAIHSSAEDVEPAFPDAFFVLDRRISLLLSLPLKALDNVALKRELDNIGRTLTPATKAP